MRALGAGAAAAGIALWIALSLTGGPGGGEAPEPGVGEGEPAGGEAPPPPAPALSFRIEPPPEVVTNPALPEEPSAAEPGGAAMAVGGIFTPEELAPEGAARYGSVRAGAVEMAPVISRMEPLGHRLDPDNPVPKAVRIELRPPEPGAQDAPRRPRLAPPPQPQEQAQDPRPAPGSRRRYTIILGSFSREDNAKQLRDRLEREGLPAEVVSVVVNNQPWWRVMSGVFEDQAAAEAYGRELRRNNLVERPYIKLM
jgi:cell division septation protein DedD